jgi:phosphoglycerate dehydrogenase-like enzyme
MMTQAEQHRVLITIPLHEAGVARLAEVAIVERRPGASLQSLERLLQDCHALIVGSETLVPDEILEKSYHLQVIGVAGASLDHLNVRAARAQGVEVINVPDQRTLAIAEQTISLMLSLGHRHHAVGLAGKTLGIVGFGAVGHEVARRARAFDMRILVNQPRLTPELALEAGAEPRDLRLLLEESDFVSLHVPTTPETQGMIGKDELHYCKPSGYLISAGSPAAVKRADLLSSLSASSLAGAAIVIPQGWEERLAEEPPNNLLLVQSQSPDRARVEQEIALNLADHIIAALETRRRSNPLSLRIVPLKDVLPHEHFDPERVEDLTLRLVKAKTLVNPPVVVPWEDHYIVLDGATRVTALKNLGYPHIVVQLIAPENEELSLQTWHHAATGVKSDTFIQALQRATAYSVKLAPVGSDHPLDWQAEGAISRVLLPSGGSFSIYPRRGIAPFIALNALVEDYAHISRIYRTFSTDWEALAGQGMEVGGLVIFPRFTLKDVLDAAIGGQLFPAGITRFIIPGRILRLHADLERLRADESLTRKNAWLDRLLADKLNRRHVRHYQEPVVLLDE